MISTAEAPSEIWDDVPAVCRPSGSTALEAGQPLEGGVAQPLVGVDDAVGRGERRDLALEPALVDRDPGLLLRGQAERVEVGAGQPAAAGDPVGGLELVGHVDRPVVRARVARPRRDVGAERDAGHRLDPAGDADVDGAGGDHVVHQVRGLLARAALGVDGGGAGALGEPGVQPGPADHVVGLLTGLGDAAADHLVDQLRVDPGAAQHLGLGEAQQRRRVHAREPAVPLAERRADGVDDHGVAHGTETRTRSCFGQGRHFRTYREYVTSRTRTRSRIREADLDL